MKRLALALTIFACGTGALLALHRVTVQLQHNATETSRVLLGETQQLAQARLQLSSITEQVGQLKAKLELEEQTVAASEGGAWKDIPADLTHLTPEQSERLLAELGFNWATSGDYLVISKDTLRAISLLGMSDAKIGEPAVGVLAITPQERASVEAVTQGLMKEYNDWVQTHAQRVQPSGNVVAEYNLPADSTFSQSLSNSFVNGLLGALGTERGNLMLDYSRSWMQDLGMDAVDGTNSFIVSRYPGSTDPHYSFMLRYSGSTRSTDVLPYQEFPPAFLPLFPNGWPDLARREGFDLPKEFRKEK